MNEQVMSLAVLFHETYERLAPQFGYETRTETRRFDPDSANGRLMIAVCAELQAALRAPSISEVALREALGDGWEVTPGDSGWWDFADLTAALHNLGIEITD